MAKMGDQVQTNEKELIKKAEKDYIENCIQKDEQAKQQDILAKVQKRQKNLEMLHYLESQVSEKKSRLTKETESNRQFV
jgi:hypothetical protein